MRVSRLARLIEEAVPPIPEPDPALEQYTTPGDIAARLVHTIIMREGAPRRVADLGAGTCRLSLPLLLLGAGSVIAVDADPRLPGYCIGAAEDLGVEERLSYIVSRIIRGSGPLAPGSVDIVVMNPPFGVQTPHADTEIIIYALSLRPRSVYAILKSGNEQYHSRLARSMGYRFRVLYRERFPLPATMRHHRSRMRRVDVDVAVFERED